MPPHKSISQQGFSHVLKLLHMDLMGPMKTESLRGKHYVLFVVDDFSKYSWVRVLREKSEAFAHFQTLVLQIQREKDLNVK